MGFESGRISYRIFFAPRTLPDDAVEQFAQHAAPAINGSGNGHYKGWVTGRHLLDRHIDAHTAFYGGHLRLALLNAERKIPTALLRAECTMEELALMASNDSTQLTRKQKIEIKKSVMDRLQPNMPPQLKGIPFVYDDNSLTVYAGALPVTQMDLFSVYFTHTLGYTLVPCLPDTLAMQRKRVDVRDWWPTSFSPKVADDEVDVQPGRDFLTWLWYLGEARGATVTLPGIGDVSILLQGPLTFILEGDGAHEIVLRKGEPLYSAETKACLLAGKKLRRAKLTLAQGEETWEVTFDGDEFTFRGLRLPDTERLDPISRFQERMILLDRFREMFFALYDIYIEERNEPAAWKETTRQMREWVQTRSERR